MSDQPKPAILKCPHCGCKALQADALTMCCSRAIKDALANQHKPASGEMNAQNDPEFPAVEAYVKSVIIDALAGAKQQLAAEREWREQMIDQLEIERKRTAAAVEALKEVQLYRHSWDTTHPCSLVADIADAALAKIGGKNWIRAEDNPGYGRPE